MNTPSSIQLELIGTASRQPHPSRIGVFGVVLDQQEFLQFLSEEWLHPSSLNWLVLGTSDACAVRTPHDAAVAIWFDVQKLPDATVLVWRKGTWCEKNSRSLQRDDGLVAWSGPLPLFAVDHFEVKSESIRVQILALARNFTDMTMPTQSIAVREISYVAPPIQLPPGSTTWLPPKHWDAVRGAAAMAAYAVPAIDPWVDLFCQALHDGEAAESAESLHAPWLKVPLWSYDISEREDLPALWRAMVGEFTQPGRLREWRAKSILESICTKALSLGEAEERIQKLRSGAMDLLNDRGTVEEVAALDDYLVLTLQLVLLRPSPEKFLEWREDWGAIPPAVWWTGMTLAGYLSGYRSLPKQFRGTSESQKLLALKTWQLAGEDSSGPWDRVTAKQVNWKCSEDTVVLLADKKPWVEHKLGTRGHWFQADFDEKSIHDEAESLALHACPEAMVSVITVTDVSLPIGGSGVAKVAAKLRRLDVKGCIELPIGRGVAVQTRLDVARFKDWLATASITQRIRRPLVANPNLLQSGFDTSARALDSKPKRASSDKPTAIKKLPKLGKASAQTIAAPTGLRLLQDFITPEEEEVLLATIDSLDWDRSMKRRVQHYGWRYDYKARKVDPKNYLGPLPAWAQKLAERLLKLQVVSELPDQVIVNNYDGNQGITKHIDCPECFSGPVATISLLATWDMVFTRKLENGTSERFVQALPQRSVAVLAGEARSDWYHEIPARISEYGVPRIRRVSITFRKVVPTITG